jgi:hypothetical protein
MATKVKTAALILPARSVLKLSRPIASPPSTTVNCSHDKKVRSLAKKTVVSHITLGEGNLLVRRGRGAQFSLLWESQFGCEGGIEYRDGFGGGAATTWRWQGLMGESGLLGRGREWQGFMR